MIKYFTCCIVLNARFQGTRSEKEYFICFCYYFCNEIYKKLMLKSLKIIFIKKSGEKRVVLVKFNETFDQNICNKPTGQLPVF